MIANCGAFSEPMSTSCVCTSCNAGYWSADGGSTCIPDPWASACAATSVNTVLLDTGAVNYVNGWCAGQLGSDLDPIIDAEAQSFVAADSYDHVTIQVVIGYYLHSADQEWQFYLSTAVGPTAVDADLVASVSFIVPYDKPVHVGSEAGGAYPTVPTILFQDVSLTKGTKYYVTMYATGPSKIDFPYWSSAQNAISGLAAYQVGNDCNKPLQVAAPWQSDFENSVYCGVLSLTVTACNDVPA